MKTSISLTCEQYSTLACQKSCQDVCQEEKDESMRSKWRVFQEDCPSRGSLHLWPHLGDNDATLEHLHAPVTAASRRSPVGVKGLTR